MQTPHTYILIPYTKDRRARLEVCIKAIQENTEGMPYSLVLYENDYIGFPNAILNMIEGINGYVVMYASDLVAQKDWLKILWQEYEKIGRKGAIEPENILHKGTLCQHPLLHTDLVRKFFHREYFHSFCDNEMHERFVAEGLYTYCPDAKIEHHHVVNRKAEMDEGYKVVLDPKRKDIDLETYKKRKANGWK